MCVNGFLGGEDLGRMEGMAVADDDGAAEPLGHGKFALEGIVIDDDMFIEFHDMVVVELFFVDIDSGCCNATHDNLNDNLNLLPLAASGPDAVRGADRWGSLDVDVLVRLVLLTEFFGGEAALHWLRHGVGDEDVGLDAVGGFCCWLGGFLVHSDEGDVVDEAEVARGFLSFIIEEAGDALDVFVLAGLEGELLEAVVVDEARGAHVLAAFVEDAQTDVELDVVIDSPFLDEDGLEGEDELVLPTETGVGMDGEALSVEQVLVAQGEELGGVPQVGGVAARGKDRHHVVVAVDKLNLVVDGGVALLQIAVDLVELLRMAVVIDDGRVELRLGDAVLLEDGVDVVLRLRLPLLAWQFVDDALHDVVVIQHILHLATRQDVFGTVVTCHKEEHEQRE